MYETGERTGTLDESCRRLAVWHREEGSRQLKALAEWVPKLVYLLVAGFVAWQVIRFWTGYFSGIQKAVDF
jgi:type II secretory pathway component PulF